MISKTVRFVCIVNTNIYEYLYTVCTESLNSVQPIDGLYKITKTYVRFLNTKVCSIVTVLVYISAFSGGSLFDNVTSVASDKLTGEGATSDK